MSLLNIAADSTPTSDRISQRMKDRNDKAWYKEKINMFSARAFRSSLGYGEINEFTRKKVNYDLFNNIVDLQDFEYVCQPYGAQQGEMPARMINRDIVSNKIKLLLGMEMQRPFGWKIVAVNEEATTRKEQEQTKRLSQYVISEIMTPIQQDIELKYQEQTKGRKLSPDEQNQINQQIQQELAAQTPPEVQQYMLRQHQDPAEVLANQILDYVVKVENVPFKFNIGWKHAMLAGEEYYWVGIINGKPVLRVVNPLYFDHERSPEHHFVDEGSWAVQELRLTCDEVVKWFSSEMTEDQINELYTLYPYGNASTITTADFNTNTYAQEAYTIRVIHCEFKSLREIKFLTFINQETGKEEEIIVDENYKLREEFGDISLKSEWIPELHEGYKVGDDMFFSCGPVIGQHKDLDNLYECPLRYYGGVYDALNSQVTAPMDRVKAYQYFYDILFYRMEMLIASDKGKKLMINMNLIPKSAGIDLKQWAYYLDAIGIGFFNPSEEANKKGGANIGESVKEIDLSLASQINNYILLMEKIEERAGTALGITRQMEGQLGMSDAVTNTKQSIVQSSYILEPYFDFHNNIKQRVLQGLVEVAKTAYIMNPPKSLSYVLDDMSLALITLNDENLELLENSTYGLFVSNSSQAAKAKALIEELAHAAVQNQLIDLSDVIKVVRAENVQEAEELLEVSEGRKRSEAQQQGQQEQQAAAQEAEKARQFTRETWAEQRGQIILKEEERRKTVLQSDVIKAEGFNDDKDMNDNGQPDVLDIEEHMLNIQATNAKTQLERDKLNHKQKDDAEKNRLAEKKLAIDKQKAQQKPKS